MPDHGDEDAVRKDARQARDVPRVERSLVTPASRSLLPREAFEEATVELPELDIEVLPLQAEPAVPFPSELPEGHPLVGHEEAGEPGLLRDREVGMTVQDEPRQGGAGPHDADHEYRSAGRPSHRPPSFWGSSARTASQRAQIVRWSYLAAVRRPSAPMRARSRGSPMSCRIDADSAATSPSATSRPSTPSVIMSAGPVGQSKLTTGSPTAMASRTTMGNPSARELSTKMAASAISSASRSVWPMSITRPLRRWATIRPFNSALSRPAPKMRSRQSGYCSETPAKAAINRSKPF